MDIVKAALLALNGLLACWLLLSMRRARQERVRRLAVEPADSDDAGFIDLLNDITATALRAPDLGTLVQNLADRMALLIGADGCYITFWDGERRLTKPMAAYGPLKDSYPKTTLPAGRRTFTQSLVEVGRTIVIPDTAASSYLSKDVASIFPAKSMIGLPMESDGQVFGAIMIGFDAPHEFSQVEIARCERGARHVSFAVAKLRLLEEEKRRSGELAALNRIGLAIGAGLNSDEVIHSIFVQCRQIIDIDIFYLALYDDATKIMSFPVFFDEGALIPVNSVDLGSSRGLASVIIETKRSLFIADTEDQAVMADYPMIVLSDVPPRSFIGVPLLVRDKVIGVLSAQSRRPNAYVQRHVRLLETIAAQSAVALENARLYEEVKRLSTMDALTGIYNFRSLFELGPREFAKARRTGRPLAALFLDVDHFRNFNARFGHAVGNVVLAGVAEAARGKLRDIDFFARYGGEEFVALLPEAGMDDAAAAAERVRAAVEAAAFSSHDGASLSVTVSVGVAILIPDMRDLEDLLDAANAAERKAKDLGRNRVVRADSESMGGR
ncbi:MAG: diguanylate cyclase [Spirochaetales bacterium]|nr:diguanylate cyclase [Spirochaetales bacterium]